MPGVRPCPHCEEMVEVDADVDLHTATCPNAHCGRPLHVEDEAEERRFLNYRRQRGVKECSQCGFRVEKEGGCNRMRCRWVRSKGKAWGMSLRSVGRGC